MKENIKIYIAALFSTIIFILILFCMYDFMDSQMINETTFMCKERCNYFGLKYNDTRYDSYYPQCWCLDEDKIPREVTIDE